MSNIEVVSDAGGYGHLTVRVDRPTIIPQGMVFFFEAGQDLLQARFADLDGSICGGKWRPERICRRPG